MTAVPLHTCHIQRCIKPPRMTNAGPYDARSVGKQLGI